MGERTRSPRRNQSDPLVANVPDPVADVATTGVKAVGRTVQLLWALAENDGRLKALQDVARRAGMPEPTALRYLNTLVGLGMVEHEGSGADSRYRLGLSLFSLAERALGNLDIRAVALPYMQHLLDTYQETVNLAVFRQRRLIIIEVLEGLRAIRQGGRVGEQDRLRTSALGKAILATYSDDEALVLLHGQPLDKTTPKTIITDNAMLRELCRRPAARLRGR